jgi:nucleotide-binding universal stress UspA family protein
LNKTMATQLLVPIHTLEGGNTANLASHVSLIARHLEADVQVLAHVADYPKTTFRFGRALVDVPSIVASTKAACRERGKALVDALRSALDTSGLQLSSSEAECLIEEFGDVAAGRGRYCDLVVVGVVAGDSSIDATTTALVFGAGRPIILVPEVAEPSAPNHIMIAWDGSRYAARAVLDSLDLLRRAKDVSIVTVTDEKTLPDGDVGEQLRQYLAYHDIQAKRSMIERRSKAIGTALQMHAAEIGANLLVMGGFGHSKVRDFVLGGATRGIVKDVRLPVLLSH